MQRYILSTIRLDMHMPHAYWQGKIAKHLQDVVPRIERQLCVENSAANAKGFQEQAQAEALVDGVDK